MAYPTLSTGRTFMVGYEQSTVFAVQRHRFVDGTSQRYLKAPQRVTFTIVHSGASKADRDTLVTWFDSVRGDNQLFDLTVDGTTYQNLALDAAEMTITERENGQYDCTFKASQTK